MEKTRPFTSRPARWESVIAIAYIPVHIYLLPRLLVRTAGQSLDAVSLNVVCYVIAALLLLFCMRRFLFRDFNALCEDYAKKHLGILRADGMRRVDDALQRGCKVVIISASIDNWVSPFFQGREGIEIAGTQIEVTNGKLTGRFLTRNCYGKEKVERLLQLYPDRKSYRLVAYGDSRGDRELLAFADESHYREFKG